jgi:hypothetical protein
LGAFGGLAGLLPSIKLVRSLKLSTSTATRRARGRPLALAAGTALDAPQQTLPVGRGIGSSGWKADIRVTALITTDSRLPWHPGGLHPTNPAWKSKLQPRRLANTLGRRFQGFRVQLEPLDHWIVFGG